MLFVKFPVILLLWAKNYASAMLEHRILYFLFLFYLYMLISELKNCKKDKKLQIIL